MTDFSLDLHKEELIEINLDLIEKKHPIPENVEDLLFEMKKKKYFGKYKRFKCF